MSVAYYNENDPRAAAWLRELIEAGLIAGGFVDERSIEDVRPDELIGFDQCHFFAGIGGWSYALRLAGWRDDQPVWTGSCPCQPFSTAGKGGGAADERHLWPAFYHLIAQCHPTVVFGEQVAGRAGLEWLDLVQTDLEASGYAVGAANLGAHSVGAPHIRQRLYWVGDSRSARTGRNPGAVLGAQSSLERVVWSKCDGPVDASATGGLADADRNGQHAGDGRCAPSRYGQTAWADRSFIDCRDGKSRPVEPGVAPLAHGVPARVVRLRGYGNAIVPQVAAEFIKASINV